MTETAQPGRKVTSVSWPNVVLWLTVIVNNCMFLVALWLAWGLPTTIPGWISAWLASNGLLFAARQIWNTRRIAKNNYEWNQCKATMDYLNGFYVCFHDFLHACAVPDGTTGLYTVKDFDISKTKNKDNIIQFQQMMNYFERLACGIKHRVYDADVAYDSNRGFVCYIYHQADTMIKNGRKNHSKLYECLQELVETWDARYKDAIKIPARPLKWD